MAVWPRNFTVTLVGAMLRSVPSKRKTYSAANNGRANKYYHF